MSKDKHVIRGPWRTVVSVTLIAFLASAATVATLQIRKQGRRIAVQVTADTGKIVLANRTGAFDEVNWVCDGVDPVIHVVKSQQVENHHWEEAVQTLIPGAKLLRTWTTTHTMQAQTEGDSGEVLRRVQAVRARLQIETKEGTIEPALGLSASVAENDRSMATSYLAIVRLIGTDGTPKLIDASPLFNQKPVSLVDRARGLPAHMVRFDLEIVEPTEAEVLDEETRAEEERKAREAIERLRNNRPERGVIPGAPQPGAGATGTGTTGTGTATEEE